MFVRNNRAFTLIELLVVVLIIGILSAIALPQYTLAVEKARAVEAITLMNSLQKAIDVYVMENGYQDVDFLRTGGLAVDMQNDLDCSSDSLSCYGKHFGWQVGCHLHTNRTICQIGIDRILPRNDGGGDWYIDYEIGMTKNASTGEWEKWCGWGTNYAQKLCNSLRSDGWTEIYGI